MRYTNWRLYLFLPSKLCYNDQKCLPCHCGVYCCLESSPIHCTSVFTSLTTHMSTVSTHCHQMSTADQQRELTDDDLHHSISMTHSHSLTHSLMIWPALRATTWHLILTIGTSSFLTSLTARCSLARARFSLSSTVINTWRSSFKCSQFVLPRFCSSYNHNSHSPRIPHSLTHSSLDVKLKWTVFLLSIFNYYLNLLQKQKQKYMYIIADNFKRVLHEHLFADKFL